jgi:hypothetical protein
VITTCPSARWKPKQEPRGGSGKVTSSDRKAPTAPQAGRGSFQRTECEANAKNAAVILLPLIIWMGLFEVAQSEMRVCAIAVLKAFGSNVEAL